MKNIYVLSTPNLSRLHEYDYLSPMGLSKEPLKWRLGRNIYITNDEEIKEGDWFVNFDLLGRLDTIYDPIHKCLKVSNSTITSFEVQVEDEFTILKSFCKKIILTTDQDLIKDGVQAIDDEFLEWFVNNPSCEEIEVENIPNNSWGFDLEEPMNLGYKIILPKEELKQLTDLEIAIKLEEIQREESKEETLEEIFKEAALKYAEQENSSYTNDYYGFINGAIEGVKWQKEQSKNRYSEEEVLRLLLNCPTNTEKETIEWFEKFKKK